MANQYFKKRYADRYRDVLEQVAKASLAGKKVQIPAAGLSPTTLRQALLGAIRYIAEIENDELIQEFKQKRSLSLAKDHVVVSDKFKFGEYAGTSKLRMEELLPQTAGSLKEKEERYLEMQSRRIENLRKARQRISSSSSSNGSDLDMTGPIFQAVESFKDEQKQKDLLSIEKLTNWLKDIQAGKETSSTLTTGDLNSDNTDDDFWLLLTDLECEGKVSYIPEDDKITFTRHDL